MSERGRDERNPAVPLEGCKWNLGVGGYRNHAVLFLFSSHSASPPPSINNDDPPIWAKLGTSKELSSILLVECVVCGSTTEHVWLICRDVIDINKSTIQHQF